MIEIKGTMLSIAAAKRSFDLKEIFNIDPEDLSTAYIEQAGLYAYFSALQADVEHKLSLAKFATDQEYASADEAYRAELALQDKKFTETVIRNLVLRDEDYTDAYNRQLDLEHQVNILKAITRALAQRGDMLVSLGALTRQEMSMTGMTMLEKQSSQGIKDAIQAAKKRKNQV